MPSNISFGVYFRKALSKLNLVILGAGFIKFQKLFQKLLVMGAGGEGGRHSNSTFYSVKLCVMINFSLHHNVLCLSFVVFCTARIAYMQLLKWFSLMKEVVMCNKHLRLKSPLKVNRPLEFIEAP